MSIAVVLSTFPADQDPTPLARTLVEERLAACVNVLPVMRSIYRWKGAMEAADERQLVIKTAANRVPALLARLAVLHPYDLPEAIVLDADGGADAYLSWVTESTSP